MSIGDKTQTDESLADKANAAFLKASGDVLKKARQAGTAVIVWRDNRIVRLPVDEAACLVEERRRNGP